MNAQSPAAAARDGVVLRLHPHVGDTLRTRLEQQTEVSAQFHGGANAPRTMLTSVTILARTIVQASRASTVVRESPIEKGGPYGPPFLIARENP